MTAPLGHKARRKIQGLRHQAEFWAFQPDREECQRRSEARGLVSPVDFSEVALVGPLGSGKTFSLGIKAHQLAQVNRGVNGMLVVPTYPLFRAVHKLEWPDLWRKVYGITVPFLVAESAFRWPWGDLLFVRSAEHPQRLAGPNLGHVLFDEPGQMKEEAWERASVRARNPAAAVLQVALAGTPEGINWFADRFAAPKFPSHIIRADTWHPDMAGYQARILSTYGHDASLVAAYARGLFVPLRRGRCYRSFNRAAHVTPRAIAYDSRRELFLACDFNVDHMAWLVVQRTDRQVRVLDEIRGPEGTTTADVAELFAERWADRARDRPITVVGDASGHARSTSGPEDYAQLRRVLKAHGWERVQVRAPRQNPRQKDSVDATNHLLAGLRKRLHISPGCELLIRDLERVSWKKGGLEIDKRDEELTHASDALRYLVWVFEKPRITGAGAAHGRVRMSGAVTDQV